MNKKFFIELTRHLRKRAITIRDYYDSSWHPVLLIIYRFQPVVATACLKSHIENAHMTGRYRREIALTDKIPGKGIIGGANRKYHLSGMVDKATKPNRLYLYSADGL